MTADPSGSATGVVSGSSSAVPPGFGSGAQVSAVVPAAAPGAPVPEVGTPTPTPVLESGPAPGTATTAPRLSAGNPLARTGADLSVVLAIALLLVLLGLHLSRLGQRRVAA